MQPAPSRPTLPVARKVDHGQTVLNAFGVMLDTPGVDTHRAIGFTYQACRFGDVVWRNSRYSGSAIRGPVLNRIPDSIPPRCVRRNVVVPYQSVAVHNMQHGKEQRQVGAWTDRKVKVG